MAEPAGFLSVRDPDNFAISVDGCWFRIASRQSAEGLRRLRESPLYQEMTERSLLVTFHELSTHEGASVLEYAEHHALREVATDSVVFSVQEVPEITYPWEWPNALLAAAGRLTLDFRLALLNEGLDLKDASAFNVQFTNGSPIFMDIGSIEPWRPNPSWNAGKQFIEHFINPLAVGYSGGVSSADAWTMSRGRGVPSSVARDLMPRSLKRRFGLAILQASTRPVAKNAPSEIRYREVAQEDQGLALRATRSFTTRLSKTLGKLESDVHDTTWSDYGSREHYSESDLQRKKDFSQSFLARLELKDDDLVLDVGGNDGMTALSAVSVGPFRFVVLDVDAGALDHLANRIKVEGGRFPVTPLVGDITDLTPASGLLDREFAAFRQRIRPSAVFCQAVLHHVVITQGVPMPLAVASLAQFEAPLQIEFADSTDAKVQLLMKQIPNWQGQYSLELLIESLSEIYDSVEVVGSTSPTRVVVEASGHKGPRSAVAHGN